MRFLIAAILLIIAPASGNGSTIAELSGYALFLCLWKISDQINKLNKKKP